MQFLIFHLDKDRYALATAGLLRVLPLMELKSLPQAPAFVAGLMNLHGSPVPVIDLCRLACGRSHAARFDTRILLVEYPMGEGQVHRLGLIAEQVEGMARFDAAQLSGSGVSSEKAPYLGKVGTHGNGIVQILHPEQLLTDDVRSILFPENGGKAT
ncbi:chemotaxis protein CheW [Noviherbaspirillum aerium]|uniref:chemotaxis protein CheW n=1 Tax=Noviherbaspirillum aerium TaxID=2588497 RepID=UPI00124F030A|nr:chemotaxis protein CheW [Noviherbaspirillum aerium]